MTSHRNAAARNATPAGALKMFDGDPRRTDNCVTDELFGADMTADEAAAIIAADDERADAAKAADDAAWRAAVASMPVCETDVVASVAAQAAVVGVLDRFETLLAGALAVEGVDVLTAREIAVRARMAARDCAAGAGLLPAVPSPVRSYTVKADSCPTSGDHVIDHEGSCVLCGEFVK